MFECKNICLFTYLETQILDCVHNSGQFVSASNSTCMHNCFFEPTSLYLDTAGLAKFLNHFYHAQENQANLTNRIKDPSVFTAVQYFF